EVLAGPVRRDPAGSTRVDQVVINLRRIETAARDHLPARRSVPESGNAGEADQPLLAEPVERIGDGAAPEHLLHADRIARWRQHDLVVQLQEVDRVDPQARKTLLQAALYLAADVAECLYVEPHLRRQVPRTRRLRQQPADRLLRLAVAIGGSRVDPVHSRLVRPPERRRSEERRVGEEWSARGSRGDGKTKKAHRTRGATGVR